MKKETVIQILNQNNATVKKHFGQNFLLDENVLDNITSKSQINKESYVIEIGPGLGFLTDKLSKNAKKVLCYEIDSQMVEILNQKNYSNVTIIQKDFLKANINLDIKDYLDDKEVIIVANLPYYITSPILLKVLEETNKVNKMIVMMQKEVGLRLCGKPSTKDYNALSVLIQYFTNPKILFSVEKNSFYPVPNVDSCVLEIEYKKTLNPKAFSEEYFLKFNRLIFANRRKTLMNNLQKAYNYDKKQMLDILDKFNINPLVRSEALTVNQIIDLANEFYQTFEQK